MSQNRETEAIHTDGKYAVQQTQLDDVSNFVLFCL